MSYADFLATKTPAVQPVGFDAGRIVAAAKPWQAQMIRWALRLGRAAIFADCGLGKTLMALEWSRQVAEHTGGRVLNLAPLAVTAQTVREAERFGIESVGYARSQAEVSTRIVVTNYDRLDDFEPSSFAGVVLDECFAPGTMVDVVDENGDGAPRPIETVRVGSRIRNAVGVDVVSDVHRREVTHAVRVTAAGAAFIASPNHPFFTQRGWVGAQDLRPGDHALVTTAAVSLVRGDFRAEVPGGLHPAILRTVLLSELADEPAGAFGQSPHPGSGSETRATSLGVVEVREAAVAGRDRAHARHGSGRKDHRDPCEDLPPIARDEARTFRAWGQRAWFDATAADSTGCTWTELGGGICLVVGPTRGGLSNALQARLGAARAARRHRGGWSIPPQSPSARREEGREAAFARVDGIEVLEPGHPDLERLRSADGKLYFYDLGGTRHPSFSVAGLLVHNSSILKSFMGKTKRQLVEAFANTRFKLACTATPSPNDTMELGNHCEFLGVMSSHEMLARWFINDTMAAGKYRLKGHAEVDFWRWVVSWAACVAKPSDLLDDGGRPFDATGYELPGLRVIEHVVEGPTPTPADGELVHAPVLTATTLHREMRRTTEERAAKAAELVRTEPNEPWLVWCNTDYEADALGAAIPEAVEVRGSMKPETKTERLHGFALGNIRVLLTKPSVAAWGLNYQHAARAAFVGLSYSYEQFYQALRREYRFGQRREVHAHVICARTESGVRATIARKQEEHRRLQARMVEMQRQLRQEEAAGVGRAVVEPHTRDLYLPKWLLEQAG